MTALSDGVTWRAVTVPRLAHSAGRAYVSIMNPPETPRMRMRPLATALLALVASPTMSPSGFAADRTPAAAHRALYELTLESAKGGEISGAHGTMAYEVTDACDGWASRQRLSLVITNRDGQDIETVSDYATWESKDGLAMRFRMKQTTDTAVTEQAEGDAKLDGPGGTGTIHYTLPEDKTMAMPRGTLFPMAHTDAILTGAEAGKKFLSLPIFDGTGDKGAQDSSVSIISWTKGGPAAYPLLTDMPSGRVRIAFFDRITDAGKPKADGSPDYEVSMKYWANGVADDLHMDFSDFVMQGKLREFVPQPPHC